MKRGKSSQKKVSGKGLSMEGINSVYSGIASRLDEMKSILQEARHTTSSLPGLDEPAVPVVLSDLFPPLLMPVYIRDFVSEPGVAVSEMVQDSHSTVSSVSSESAPTSMSSISVDLSTTKPSFKAIDHLSDHIESLTSEVKEVQLTRKLKRVASRTQQKSAVIAPVKVPVAESVSGLTLKDDRDIEKRRKAREKRVTDLLDSGKDHRISSSSV